MLFDSLISCVIALRVGGTTGPESKPELFHDYYQELMSKAQYDSGRIMLILP